MGRSIRYGGQNIDSNILKNIANKHNLLIGTNSAEKAKIDFATVNLPKPAKRCILKGKDIVIKSTCYIKRGLFYNCFTIIINTIYDKRFTNYEHGT